MISNIYVIKAESYFPYHNQAVEKYLFDTVDNDSLILYLWQNIDTVFIGKNQNAYNECNIDLLEKKDNGFLARRISGGGAVYHDLGNLNFTFISSIENYDLDKQNKVILNALDELGIDATVNGRNDLEINGRKFSGHAYYKGKKNAFHHGTIMIEVNEESLQKYLNVSMIKLNAKNVESVKSRVVNLKDLDDTINVKVLKRALINSLSAVYGLEPMPLYEENLNEDIIKALQEEFSSAEWKYGNNKVYAHSIEKRFDWATVRIEYDLEGDCIKDMAIYSDALYPENIENIPSLLKGKKISELEDSNIKEVSDIIALLKEKENEI